jgi:hypothetical protein
MGLATVASRWRLGCGSWQRWRDPKWRIEPSREHHGQSQILQIARAMILAATSGELLVREKMRISRYRRRVRNKYVGGMEMACSAKRLASNWSVIKCAAASAIRGSRRSHYSRQNRTQPLSQANV